LRHTWDTWTHRTCEEGKGGGHCLNDAL
jgi:hypothetical protein